MSEKAYYVQEVKMPEPEEVKQKAIASAQALIEKLHSLFNEKNKRSTTEFERLELAKLAALALDKATDLARLVAQANIPGKVLSNTDANFINSMVNHYASHIATILSIAQRVHQQAGHWQDEQAQDVDEKLKKLSLHEAFLSVDAGLECFNHVVAWSEKLLVCAVDEDIQPHNITKDEADEYLQSAKLLHSLIVSTWALKHGKLDTTMDLLNEYQQTLNNMKQ